MFEHEIGVVGHGGSNVSGKLGACQSVNSAALKEYARRIHNIEAASRYQALADVPKLETRERMHMIGVAEAKAKARDLRERQGDAFKQIANLQANVDTYAAGRSAPFTATAGQATIGERAAFDAALTAHALDTIKQDDKAERSCL